MSKTIQKIKEKTLEWQERSKEEVSIEALKDFRETDENGYRLPTIEELVIAFYGDVEGFDNLCFWVSSVNNKNNNFVFKAFFSEEKDNDYTSKKAFIRLVKEI